MLHPRLPHLYPPPVSQNFKNPGHFLRLLKIPFLTVLMSMFWVRMSHALTPKLVKHFPCWMRSKPFRRWCWDTDISVHFSPATLRLLVCKKGPALLLHFYIDWSNSSTGRMPNNIVERSRSNDVYSSFETCSSKKPIYYRRDLCTTHECSISLGP